jgi:hypothetical protein
MYTFGWICIHLDGYGNLIGIKPTKRLKMLVIGCYYFNSHGFFVVIVVVPLEVAGINFIKVLLIIDVHRIQCMICLCAR